MCKRQSLWFLALGANKPSYATEPNYCGQLCWIRGYDKYRFIGRLSNDVIGNADHGEQISVCQFTWTTFCTVVLNSVEFDSCHPSGPYKFQEAARVRIICEPPTQTVSHGTTVNSTKDISWGELFLTTARTVRSTHAVTYTCMWQTTCNVPSDYITLIIQYG
jgi:hypothetical protein